MCFMVGSCIFLFVSLLYVYTFVFFFVFYVHARVFLYVVCVRVGCVFIYIVAWVKGNKALFLRLRCVRFGTIFLFCFFLWYIGFRGRQCGCRRLYVWLFVLYVREVFCKLNILNVAHCLACARMASCRMVTYFKNVCGCLSQYNYVGLVGGWL